jgi:hypothetical protein
LEFVDRVVTRKKIAYEEDVTHLTYIFALAQLREHKIDMEGTSSQVKRRQLSRTLSSPKDIRFISSRLSRDPPQLKVVVVLMLQKLNCVATLGELCLQTDMNSISFCACHKVEKQQGTLVKRASVGMVL